MQRRYRQKKYHCGEYVEVMIYPIYAKAKGRGKRCDADVGDDAYIVPRADVGIRPYKLNFFAYFHFLRSFPKRYRHTSAIFGKAMFAADKTAINAKRREIIMKNNNQINVPQAKQAMEQFKMQAASEVGVNLTNGYNGHLTSREAGSVGGQMVKKMIEAYEQGLQ